MSSDLVHGKNNLSLLEPQSLDEVMRVSEMLAASQMVPKSYQGSPGNVLVAILAGRPLGLHAFHACQSFAVINGMPSLYGDAPLAIVRASSVFESINETNDGQTAVCTVKRRGEDVVVRKFSMDDAKKARLLEKQGPWQTNPSRMLMFRARAFALRDTFGDILKGIGIAEEQEDVAVATAATIVVEQPKNLGAGAVKAALTQAADKAETVVTEMLQEAKASVKEVAQTSKAAQQSKKVEPAVEPEPLEPEPEMSFGDIWRQKLKGIKQPAAAMSKRLFELWNKNDVAEVERIAVEEYPEVQFASHEDKVKIADFIDAIGRDIKSDSQ